MAARIAKPPPNSLVRRIKEKAMPSMKHSIDIETFSELTCILYFFLIITFVFEVNYPFRQMGLKMLGFISEDDFKLIAIISYRLSVYP